MAQALRLGCVCRNDSAFLRDTWAEPTNSEPWRGTECQQDTVRSLGAPGWVGSDGIWSPRLPLAESGAPWTLGVLTFRPSCKESPPGTRLWGKVKGDGTGKHPSAGTTAGWILESISALQRSAFRNRAAPHHWALQMGTSVNAAPLGFAEIKEQLPAPAQMTLQSRLALALLLLHGQGVCGFLK